MDNVADLEREISLAAQEYNAVVGRKPENFMLLVSQPIAQMHALSRYSGGPQVITVSRGVYTQVLAVPEQYLAPNLIFLGRYEDKTNEAEPFQGMNAGQFTGWTVSLKNRGNPDFGQHIELPLPGADPDFMIPVLSLEKAQRLCQCYIKYNSLGGGNWAGGTLYFNLEEKGYISYNGRIWDGLPEDFPNKNEILPDNDFSALLERKKNKLTQL